MIKVKFATYLHPECGLTSKPTDQVDWCGHSYPHYEQVRKLLAEVLHEYPSLPLRRVGLQEYASVHSPAYLRQLTDAAEGHSDGAQPKLNSECRGLIFCLPGYEYALGGMYEAIERMRCGSLNRAYCFALGGHHAHVDWGHGYCILNPQAAAARYAQKLGFKRILFVDWDIHHGDGTQAIFANDPTVYCVSIHSGIDLYMMKASRAYEGSTEAAAAVGHWNIPLVHGLFKDEFVTSSNMLPGKFYRATDSLPEFQKALENLSWKPDLICLCSGYDSHRDDCGADVTNWTNDDFSKLTQMVNDAAQSANCPVLSVHAGGYKIPVTIPAAVAHVRTLAGY